LRIWRRSRATFLIDSVIQPGDLGWQPQRLDRLSNHLSCLDPHPGVLIDRVLQRPGGVLLISLELLEPDLRVQRPADRDRDLLARLLPLLARHQEWPGRRAGGCASATRSRRGARP
jgi:hypothetical protein